MKPEIYGPEHLLYVLITAAVFTLLLVLLKKYITSERQKALLMRLMGVIGLLSVIWVRWCVAFMEQDGNLWYLIPDTICGTCSMFTALAFLSGKKDNNVLHAIWLIAIAGDIATMVYPDFIGDGATIFYAPTISGLWHHSWTLFCYVTARTLGLFTPDAHKCTMNLFAGAYLVVMGWFLIKVAHLPDAFYWQKPAVEGTILYLPLIVFLYLLVYIAIMLVITRLQKK